MVPKVVCVIVLTAGMVNGAIRIEKLQEMPVVNFGFIPKGCYIKEKEFLIPENGEVHDEWGECTLTRCTSEGVEYHTCDDPMKVPNCNRLVFKNSVEYPECCGKYECD